ncbi:MAG: signal peptide peptidase SppA [Flavobacteriales bacterium]|nr:signal peptide peptidase SppA [Flavobacteriales bacterium]
MKQFLKFTLASVVGISIVIGLMFLVFIGIVATLGQKEAVHLEDPSVLHLTLPYPIHDRGSNNPFDRIGINGLPQGEIYGLHDIIRAIKYAGEDEKIKGIYLDVSLLQAGMASVEELRNALINFKATGKFIVGYSEIYTQKSYYLASVANDLFLNPAGVIEFKGLSAQVQFYKRALEKLGVDIQVIRHGQFKSAVEPFMLDSMSPANREQNYVLVHSIWEQLTGDISMSRDIPAGTLNNIADSILIRRPDDALKHHLVDDLLYEDQVMDVLKENCGLDEDGTLYLVSLDRFLKAPGHIQTPRPKDKIAVIYAMGTIQGGKAYDAETMGSAKMASTIRSARKDPSVKAIVLRINSPGGSALASDVIWRELVLARIEKPLVVSMGDVAASGGYYIACAADTIVASPFTITGSIGVFGILPNLRQLMEEKLGIDFDTVNTNPYADFGNISRPLYYRERQAIQDMVEFIYDDFLEKVSDGRGIKKALVDSIGQGRVWSGSSARKIGLVDMFGDLDMAVEVAADMAKLESYRIVDLPEQKEFLEKLMEDWSGSMTQYSLEQQLGPLSKHVKTIDFLKNTKGVQALIPYNIDIE